MKQIFTILISLILYACNSGDIKISKSVSYDLRMTEHSNILASLGLVQLDSITFSDGSIAVYRLGFSPMNRLTEYKDKKGKLIATVSAGSECPDQIVVRNYDELGRLKNLLYFYYENYDDKYRDWFDGGYEIFRKKMEMIDYMNPDTARYTQINIDYDKDGEVIRTYKVCEDTKIEAPVGYKLDISVDECVNFWESDLDGGYYIFKVKMLPKDGAMKKYTRFRYADFSPVLEENYENGQIVRAVLYPPVNVEDAPKVTVSLKVDGTTHVYTTHFDDKQEKKYRFWEDGLLMKEQEVSAYGTIYRERIYSYSRPSTRVKSEDYKIDFNKNNTLQLQKSSELQLSAIGQERDEMKLLKVYDSYWINEYNESEY